MHRPAPPLRKGVATSAPHAEWSKNGQTCIFIFFQRHSRGTSPRKPDGMAVNVTLRRPTILLCTTFPAGILALLGGAGSATRVKRRGSGRPTAMMRPERANCRTDDCTLPAPSTGPLPPSSRSCTRPARAPVFSPNCCAATVAGPTPCWRARSTRWRAELAHGPVARWNRRFWALLVAAPALRDAERLPAIGPPPRCGAAARPCAWPCCCGSSPAWMTAKPPPCWASRTRRYARALRRALPRTADGGAGPGGVAGAGGGLRRTCPRSARCAGRTIWTACSQWRPGGARAPALRSRAPAAAQAGTGNLRRGVRRHLAGAHRSRPRPVRQRGGVACGGAAPASTLRWRHRAADRSRFRGAGRSARPALATDLDFYAWYAAQPRHRSRSGTPARVPRRGAARCPPHDACRWCRVRRADRGGLVVLLALLLATTAVALPPSCATVCRNCRRPLQHTLLARDAQWQAMTPAQQQALRQRIAAWDAMPPAQRRERRDALAGVAGAAAGGSPAGSRRRHRVRGAGRCRAAARCARNSRNSMPATTTAGCSGPRWAAVRAGCSRCCCRCRRRSACRCWTALRALTPAQRADLGVLAQRTPPLQRDALRRAAVVHRAVNRGGWLQSQLAR